MHLNSVIFLLFYCVRLRTVLNGLSGLCKRDAIESFSDHENIKTKAAE